MSPGASKAKARTRRSPQERYDSARPSYTKVNDKRFADLEAGTTVLIPSPQDIEAVIDDLAPAETLTLTQLRQRLAQRHGADGSCPVMTGMNLRIVADLALEAVDAGHDPAMSSEAGGEVVPFWKVVEPTSSLASKLPGGPDRIRQLRESPR
jgi:hypothetical protein